MEVGEALLLYLPPLQLTSPYGILATGRREPGQGEEGDDPSPTRRAHLVFPQQEAGRAFSRGWPQVSAGYSKSRMDTVFA